MQRRGAGLLSEFPQEIAKVIVTAFQTDIRDGQIAFFQQAPGLLDAVLVDILHGRAADGFFEKTAEILFVEADLRRQVGDIDFLSVVVFDVGENGLDVFHALVIVCLCRCEKPVLGERGQQEEQRCLDV